MIEPSITPHVVQLSQAGVFSLFGKALAQIGGLSAFTRSISDLIDLESLVSRLKIISFFTTVGLSLIFMTILMKLRRLMMSAGGDATASETQPQISGSGAVRGPYRARWDEILKHMDSAKEAEWKFAVIEADKLADLILKRGGFQGDSMGERLMSIQDGQLISLQDLWDAHKIRNQLAHNVDYFLRYSEARQAIDKYESFLEEMQAI